MIDGVYLNQNPNIIIIPFQKNRFGNDSAKYIYVYMLLQLLMYLLPNFQTFFLEILISLFSGDILEAIRNLLSGLRLALVSMDRCVACNAEFV